MHGSRRIVLCLAVFALVAHCASEDMEDEDAPGDPSLTGKVEPVDTIPEDYDEYDHDDSTDPDEEDLQRLDPQKMKAMHGKIDKNSDGKISLAEIIDFEKEHRLAEAHRGVDEHMQMIDENKDGKASQSEVVSDPTPHEIDPDTPPEHREKAKEQAKHFYELELAKFKAADKNNDGFLDQTELPLSIFPEISDDILGLMAATTMKLKDNNKDGELDVKEFWGEIGATADETTSEDKEEFDKIDLDGSGKLNLKELKTWESGEYYTRHSMDEFIKHADADKDSHISIPELEAHLEKLPGTDAGAKFSEWTSDEL